MSRYGSRNAVREQQVVSGQVLEWLEAVARFLGLEPTIEIGDRPAQGEIAPRPGVRTGEVPREEPVGRPLAEPADGDNACLHLRVGQRGERVQVDPGARQPDRVLRLAAREAERDELGLARLGKPLAPRKLPD